MQVCCADAAHCLEYGPWALTTISGESGLTVTIAVPSSCVGKQLYGLRYLWRQTPCPFNPLKPNVPSKGHCDNCNKKRNKTLYMKTSTFLD